MGGYKQQMRQDQKQVPLDTQLEEQVQQLADYLQPTENISSTNLIELIANGRYRVLHVDEVRAKESAVARELTTSNCIVETCNWKKADEWFSKSRIWDAAAINFSQNRLGDGAQLAKQLRASDPDIPIVLYVDDKQWNEFSQREETQGKGAIEYFKALQHEFGEHFDFMRNSPNHDFRYDMVDSENNPTGITIDKRSKLMKGASTSNLGVPEPSDMLYDQYSEKSIGGVVGALHKQFLHVDIQDLKRLFLKNGGSWFDSVIEDRDNPLAGKKYKDGFVSFMDKNRGEYAVFHCVGSSKFGDVKKQLAKIPSFAFASGTRHREQVEAGILNMQAIYLQAFYGEDKTYLLNPDSPPQFVIDDEFFEQYSYGIIIPYAPREIRRACNIPLAYSDLNTNAAAAYVGVRDKILYVKNVKPNQNPEEENQDVGGIYISDPQDDNFDPRTNPKLLEVSPEQMLGRKPVYIDGKRYDISRIGAEDGDGDHLIDNGGLEFMLEEGQPREIVVADSNLEDLFGRYSRGEYLITNPDNTVNRNQSMSRIIYGLDQAA